MLERGKLNSGELQDYASGLVLGTYKGLPTVDHGGADAGYRSDLIRFPEQHFSTAVLCNFANTNPSALARQVADIVLARDLKAPAPVPTKEPATAVAMTGEQMATIAGTYRGREDDDFTRLRVKDGKLEMDVGRDDFHELKPFAPAHFHVANVPWGDHVDIHFVAADAGKPSRLEQTFDGEKPEIYESVAAFDPTAAQLAEYPGPFVSQEIDPIYRISLQNGKLTLLRLKNKPDTLWPAMRDVFVGEIGTLRFTRDANHHISGFILDADRIQNFQFTRVNGYPSRP
jgi:hypothetical protein